MQTSDTRLTHLSCVHHIHGWCYMLLHLQSRSAFSGSLLTFTFVESEMVEQFTSEKRQIFLSLSLFLLWVTLYLSPWLMHKGLCCHLAITHWGRCGPTDVTSSLTTGIQLRLKRWVERGCEPAEALHRAGHSYNAIRTLIFCKMLELVSSVPWNQC